MEFSDELAALNRAVLASGLGDSVTYTPGSGPSAGIACPVRGIFDEAFYRVDLGKAGASSSSPTAFFLLADLPTDPDADPNATVTFGGRTYEIRDPIEPDGRGGVRLHLYRQT